MQFFTENHKQQYHTLLEKDNTHTDDNARKAMFYLLSSPYLYTNVLELYDFGDRCVRLNRSFDVNGAEIEKISMDFSESKRVLIAIAFNLYNGHIEYFMNPIDLSMYCETIELLIINAVMIRFNYATVGII